MSRRGQIRMSEKELQGYIADARTIILASTGPDGVPHPMPMWFAVEKGGAILMTTFTRSQKIKNIERDPRVALLVEDGEIYSELRGAVLYGKAELLRETDRVADILMQIAARSSDGNGASAGSGEGVQKAMQATAKKRTGIRVLPGRIVSWDHRKLGGVY